MQFSLLNKSNKFKIDQIYRKKLIFMMAIKYYILIMKYMFIVNLFENTNIYYLHKLDQI